MYHQHRYGFRGCSFDCVDQLSSSVHIWWKVRDKSTSTGGYIVYHFLNDPPVFTSQIWPHLSTHHLICWRRYLQLWIF